MSDSRPGWDRAVDAVAAALCEQEETAQRDCDEPWSAWGTDRLAEFVSEACYGPLVEALTTQLAAKIEQMRDEHFREYGNEEPARRGYDWALTHAVDAIRSVAAGLATPKETPGVCACGHNYDSHMPPVRGLKVCDSNCSCTRYVSAGNPEGADHMSTGVELIAAERQRQVEVEGYALEHDAAHSDESLALAAASYALPEAHRQQTYPYSNGTGVGPLHWPWEGRYWKPTPDDRVRELVKAGALIAAEIDRLSAKKQTA